MVRNSGKGGSGHKKMKNSNTPHKETRELHFKDEFQDYGIIKDMLGNGRCKVVCYSDNIERLCIIRGTLRKQRHNFMRKNDCILISLREYQSGKADVIHLYNDDEVRMLVSYNEITNQFVVSSSLYTSCEHEDPTENDIVFEDI